MSKRRHFPFLIISVLILLVSCATQITASPTIISVNNEKITFFNISDKFLGTPAIPGTSDTPGTPGTPGLPGARLSGAEQYIIVDGVIAEVSSTQVTVDIQGNSFVIFGDNIKATGPTATTVITGETSPVVGEIILTKDLIGKKVSLWVNIDHNGDVAVNVVLMH